MPGRYGFTGAPVAAPIVPPPAGQPTKLAVPYVPLAADLPNYVQANNLSPEAWAGIVAQYPRGLHYEGHNWGRLRGSDGVFQPARFKAAGGGRVSAYVNGSGVTQGSPWTPMCVAAHLERHHPFAIARIRPATGLTLAAGITNLATTIQINLPSSRPAGLPTTHPSGTPSSLWPLVGSTIPGGITPTTHSRSTSEYVSTIRISDGIIGLPAYNPATWTVSGTVLTITGCVRGMWGSTAVGHGLNAIITVPDYIGNANALANDQGLTGNPIANSGATPIRYWIATWDSARGALHDGVAVIADQARVELMGFGLSALKTVTAADAATNTLTSVAHGLTNGMRVMVAGWAIPGGIRSLTPYYVVGATADTFQVALTSGGGAMDLTSADVGGMCVGECRAPETAPVFDTVWMDVTSGYAYNHADAYGRDITTETALMPLPRDYTAASDTTPWIDRQNAKRAAVATKLSGYGFTGLSFEANNYIASTTTAVSLRVGWIADAVWDGYGLEHFAQAPAQMAANIDQLVQAVAGRDETGAVTNALGHQVICWIKAYDWKPASDGGVDTDTTVGRYLRRAYGAYLLAHRPGATNPRVLVKAYSTSLSETPTDRAGHSIFHWDFGAPLAAGGKPANPATIADLQSPSAGVWRRDYANGLVIVNSTANPVSVVADRAYYDAATETSGTSGPVLTAVPSGSTVTVPAYDAALLVTSTAAPVAGSNIDYFAGNVLLQETGSGVATLDSLAVSFADYLSRPGVTGFSVRVPWVQLYNPSTRAFDPAVYERALGMADAAGVRLDVWAMAGRWTPSWALGRSYTLTEGTSSWQIPVPFQPDGTPGDPVYEAGFLTLLDDVAAWCLSKGVRLVHPPWPGRKYAEYNNNAEIQSQLGYSIETWRTAHQRIFDMMMDTTSPVLMVAPPMTGHPNAGAGTPQADIRSIFATAVTRFGRLNDRVGHMANGWGGEQVSGGPGGSGSSARVLTDLLFGHQMYGNTVFYPEWDWNSSTVGSATAPLPQGMFATSRARKSIRREFYRQAFGVTTGPAGTLASDMQTGMVDILAYQAANPTLM